MSFIVLAKPGMTGGPCSSPKGYERDCQHTDCAQTRAMARQQCPGCHQELGYDRPITRDGKGPLCHTACLRLSA